MQADRVLGFWTERLVPDNDAVILKDELYVAFSRWLALGGHNAWAKELFHPRFAEHVTTRQHGVSESRPRELKELQASDPPADLTDLPTIAGALVRGDLPKRPRVYTGVRFRTDDDPHDDDEQPADQRKHDPVQGGPGQKESPAGPKESEDFGFGSDHPGPPSGGYTWSPPGWTKATKLDSCTVCRHSTVERLDGRPLHRRCAAAL